MNKGLSSWIVSVLLLVGFWPASSLSLAHKPLQEPPQSFTAVRHFNVYTFNVSATGSGAVRELTVRAFRGQVLLSRFQLLTDGAVTGIDVADLDKNRLPELYVYTRSDGSGSFGRVYAWQFMPEQKAVIKLTDWLNVPTGYMGHDSLWVDQSGLCRRYPIYRPGDANALPSGGFGLLRYRLQAAGTAYVLIPEH